MSQLNSRTRSALVPPFFGVSQDLEKHQKASKPEQSLELREVVTSTDHHPNAQRMQQQQSYLGRWRSVQQMQYRRLLILVYLLLGLGLSSLVMGIVNSLTLHSLQQEVNQHQ